MVWASGVFFFIIYLAVTILPSVESKLFNNISFYSNEEMEGNKNRLLKNKKLRDYRKKYINSIIVSTLLYLILIIIGIAFNQYFEMGSLMISFLLFIFTIVYSGFTYNGFAQVCIEEGYNTVLEGFGKDYKYFPDKGIPEDFYKYADFEKFNQFCTKHLIVGNMNNISFKLATVTTSRRYRTTEGEFEEDLFGGYVFAFEVEKDINGYVSVVSKYREKNKGQTLVTVENEELNSKYNVFSNEKKLVDDILTAELINTILTSNKKNNIFIEIKWINNHIYFRFEILNLPNPEILNFSKNMYSMTRFANALTSIFDTSSELMKQLNISK